MENKEIGIYVHIPFCKQKCYYCDFISYCNKDNLIEDYIQAVKKEIELHEKFKPIAKVLTGKLTLEESAALYAVSDLFISGDSGPLHIASALNINTIGIMGSTPTYACGPYGEKGYVVEPKSDCKFCEKKVCKLLKEGEKFTPCMQSIEVCDILNLIKEENLL